MLPIVISGIIESTLVELVLIINAGCRKKLLDAMEPLVYSNLYFYVTPKSHHLHSAVLGAIQREASKDKVSNQCLAIPEDTATFPVCRSFH